MKTLSLKGAILLVVMIMSFCSNFATAQSFVSVELTTEDNQSLAQITEEPVSLQNAMALAMDIKPELYTRLMFHKDVVAYATFIGIPYYNTATNGYNNVAILHANSRGYFTNPAVYNNVGAVNDNDTQSTYPRTISTMPQGASSTFIHNTSLGGVIDSCGMSSFQKEYYTAKNYQLFAGSSCVVASSDVAGQVNGYDEESRDDKSNSSSFIT